MKLKLLTAAATAALMAAPSLASADDAGWYLRGNAGYGVHTEMDLTGDITGDVESQGNATGSVGLGYEFGNNWRLELDGASLFTDLGKVSSYPNTASKLTTNTAMLNAIYDFNDFGRWEPYVGAGIGIVRARTSTAVHDFPSATPIVPGVVNVNNPACTSGAVCSFKDTDTGLGWQLLAGLGYQVSDNLTWDTQYRYLNATNLDFIGQIDNAAGAFSMEDVGAHSVMTGFRYKFGAPTPPAMQTCWDGSSILASATCAAEPVRMKVCWNGDEIPASDTCVAQPPAMQTCWNGSEILASATCPARPTFTCPDGSIVSDESICRLIYVQNLCAEQLRSEIIYYEFDKGQSAETRNTIQNVLDTGQYCKVDNIRVVGHTDTSGPAAYNLALSKRRAADARTEFVRQGMNPAIITSEGKGETEPRIQTGDNVKERENRRTEVLIQLSEVGVAN
ncbi:MAG: OmpA family protein [Alphaproteobacteria bacterium]